MCHQTVSLTARVLEEGGLPTVVLGSARDIVEFCGVPRFYFTDFPLGSPCGVPFDADMQRRVVTAALRLFETAAAPDVTETGTERWPGDDWRRGVTQPLVKVLWTYRF